MRCESSPQRDRIPVTIGRQGAARWRGRCCPRPRKFNPGDFGTDPNRRTVHIGGGNVPSPVRALIAHMVGALARAPSFREIGGGGRQRFVPSTPLSSSNPSDRNDRHLGRCSKLPGPRSQGSGALASSSRLVFAKPNAGAATIGIDELDAGILKCPSYGRVVRRRH